jgi:FlaA1/EpsC-like NDP-sugar epimerase
MKSSNEATGLRATNLAASAWDGFLDRAPLVVDRSSVAASLRGKRILITGAGGWIGSALTRGIADFAPKQLVLLEAAERNLYEIDATLRQLPCAIERVSLLGSVSQPALLDELFRRYSPQIVFHAAAFKHVPLMEENPFAAIENNAIGTHLLVQAATANAATEQLILLSTDKAVDPVSIMGASKRIAELVMLAPRPAAARMKVVRLGNVLGSEGSIVPLFLKQIRSGQPIAVTHPEVRRYFLTTEDALALLLHAASEETPPGVLVPELGEPVRVETLAHYLMDGCGQVPIVFTQLRPGDKMCEALLSDREAYVGHPNHGQPLREVKSPCMPEAVLDEVLPQLEQACRRRSLQQLLAAVMRVVPEYQPSALMQADGGKRA